VAGVIEVVERSICIIKTREEAVLVEAHTGRGLLDADRVASIVQLGPGSERRLRTARVFVAARLGRLLEMAEDRRDGLYRARKENRNMITKNTLLQIATLVAAGLSPPGRADATASTIRQIADIEGEDLGITLADACAGYHALAAAHDGDDGKIGARRSTCGEIAGLIAPALLPGEPPGDPRKWAALLDRVAVHFAGSADPRQQAIAQTAQREHGELTAA
jgi:hypothetical protein